MNVLFLAHRVPYPPNKGDKIRAYHEILGLAERGHTVHLLAFADAASDLRHDRALGRICRSVSLIPLERSTGNLRAAAALVFGGSLSVRYFFSPAMAKAVARSLSGSEIDAIVAYSSTMAQYVPDAWRTRTVVDMVDVDSEKWRNYAERTTFPLALIYATEGRRLARYEARLARSFPSVVVTTAREAARIHELHRAADVHVIVNGVDTTYFQPSAEEPSARTRSIVFSGAMDYFPNIDAVHWFADCVWPRLNDLADVTFNIVGSNPTDTVKKLASRERVLVTGSVPDVRPYIQNAAAVVVPLRIARGIQNKVLEALACARPAVVSQQVADCMPSLGPSQAALVAEDASGFAEAIRQILTNRVFASSLGENGRQFVEREYRWPDMLDRFCGLVERTAIGSHPQQRISSEPERAAL